VGALAQIEHATLPLSPSEVDYPLLREIHASSALATADAVRAWRSGSLARAPDTAPSAVAIELPAPRAASGRGLGETIQRRGSTRQFGHASLTPAELGTALWAATRGFDADVPAGLVDLYLVVNAVDDVQPGAYVYRPAAHALELLAAGELRNRSSYLCLEQPLGGDAAAVIYFLARLDALLRAYGDRGYRLANLEAGLAGGRAYLAAYAQGFGASGLTFYDRLVVEFFSPHATGKDAIFVTALGRSSAEGRVNIGSNLIVPRRPSG
jgi:SagB-type dehydrogenase family enzyme